MPAEVSRLLQNFLPKAVLVTYMCVYYEIGWFLPQTAFHTLPDLALDYTLLTSDAGFFYFRPQPQSVAH